MRRFATLLLDLDGTLVDAFTTIHRAYCHVLPRFGLPEPSLAEVRNAVGGGLENAMRRFLREDQIPAAVRDHIAYTEKILLDDVVLLPGALELVRERAAAGVTLAAFTNKRGDHSRRICAHLGLSPHLRGIFGAKDTPWIKPQPEFATHALAALGADAASTLLVGDSPFDVAAARNGGFACWAVTTGTHEAGPLREAGAERIFSGLPELHTALRAAGG
ncbi:MAG: HAD family hydrolase [Opitutaceae bacterium]|jgi:phosphoglycolate phosphatase-like HAD superfamily hydrolase|nr:HAD family hydrolase [Opitutaceae bacterium]